MRNIQRFLLITCMVLVGGFGILSADISQNISIDAQIEAMQSAPADKRVEMMNRLKEQLAEMNQAERMETISKLRSSMRAAKHSHEMPMSHSEAVHSGMNHANEMQMQSNEHQNQMQNMNQNHAAEQLMHEGGMQLPTGGGGGPLGHEGGYGSGTMGRR